MAHPFYSSKAWREMRQMIKLRDKYRCTICGIGLRERGSSQVDHIIPRSKAPALALDPNNLRTLCRPCHIKYDQARGHKPSEPIEFIDESGLPEAWK